MQKNEHIMRVIMSISLIAAMFFWSGEAALVRAEIMNEKEKTTIVIDAGHGGRDPGKVGVNGCYEKDINLKIAEKLKEFLQAENIEIIMTRENDEGLYNENAGNKKNEDMKKRVTVIEESQPVLTVSIHQNSYGDERIKGAQTFYYGKSKESSLLAKHIQDRLVYTLDKENHRKEKSNESYYLLKNVSGTIVIVECGFLSNSKECELLNDDYYQEKVAWAIYMGIMQYLNKK